MWLSRIGDFCDELKSGAVGNRYSCFVFDLFFVKWISWEVCTLGTTIVIKRRPAHQSVGKYHNHSNTMIFNGRHRHVVVDICSIGESDMKYYGVRCAAMSSWASTWCLCLPRVKEISSTCHNYFLESFHVETGETLPPLSSLPAAGRRKPGRRDEADISKSARSS